MAEFMSGQDEAKNVFWLATPAGKMNASCSFGTSRVGPQENVRFWPYK